MSTEPGTAHLVLLCAISVLAACSFERPLSPSVGNMSASTSVEHSAVLSSPRLPYSLALAEENVSKCDMRSGKYTMVGTFKGWTSSPSRVAVSYAANDTLLRRFSLIGFSRTTKRSTDFVDCVMREGTAARKFIREWPRARNSGGPSPAQSPSSPFDGNVIWCTVEDELGYELSCNGNTCSYGEWASVRGNSKRSSQVSVSTSSVTGVPGWGCGNGCTVYFLLSGNFAFECPNNEDLGDPNGGGGYLPSDFTCTPVGPAFYATVTCTLVISGHAVADDTVAWRFEGSGEASGLVVHDTTSTFSWTGRVVASGKVFVSVTFDGLLYEKDATISVSARSGWSWSNRVSGALASPGEIDRCFTPSQDGLTASVACRDPSDSQWLFSPREAELDINNGVTVSKVEDNGPNSGLWYITSASAGMDLRGQIPIRWRADGQPYTASFQGCASTALRVSEANHCFSTSPNVRPYSSAFDSVLAIVWGHEGRHISLALAAARSPLGDFDRLLSTVVGQDSMNVVFLARARFFDAHTHVFEASDEIDSNPLLSSEFVILDHPSSGGGWIVTPPTSYAR